MRGPIWLYSEVVWGEHPFRDSLVSQEPRRVKAAKGLAALAFAGNLAFLGFGVAQAVHMSVETSKATTLSAEIGDATATAGVTVADTAVLLMAAESALFIKDANRELEVLQNA